MYVIQERFKEWDRWETIPYRRFKTLEEARAALSEFPKLSVYRIAEEYTVTKYKAVRSRSRTKSG